MSIESECFTTGLIYSTDTILRNSTQSVLLCEQLGGNSVSPTSEIEHFFLVEFLKVQLGQDAQAWIGLERPPVEDILDATDPINFQFLDGTEDQSFFEDRGQLPWRTDRPINNVVDGGDQRCVALSVNRDNQNFDELWNDVNCEGLRFPICEFSCVPTLNPTNSPSSTPTNFPTTSPSIFVENVNEKAKEDGFLKLLLGISIGVTVLGLFIFIFFLVKIKRELKRYEKLSLWYGSA